MKFVVAVVALDCFLIFNGGWYLAKMRIGPRRVLVTIFDISVALVIELV